jgi:hypothetical protein
MASPVKSASGKDKVYRTRLPEGWDRPGALLTEKILHRPLRLKNKIQIFPFSPEPLKLPEEGEHFAVQLMAVEVFIGHVGPTAVENAERTAKVPQRPAPTGFFPQG